MIPKRAIGLVIVWFASLVLAACGDDGADDPQASTGADATQAAGADTGPAAATPLAATEVAAPPAGDGGGAQDGGSATLTIGDETWEFDNFRCAFGHEATLSDEYSFSSDARGVHSNGANLQMQVDIRDDAGQGRYDGDGVTYSVSLNDISDFQNPAVDWLASSDGSLFGSGELVVVIDGDNVTAEGTFDNHLSEFDSDPVPGTLQATCSAGSIR